MKSNESFCTLFLSLYLNILSELLHCQVHWKADDSVPDAHRFVVEYRAGNESRWLRVEQEAEAAKMAGAGSLSVVAPELDSDNAFSVRVLFIDAENQALAATGEQLVAHAGGDNECEERAPDAPVVEGAPGTDSVEFSWQRPDCEGDIQGYEYAVE